MLDKKQTVVDVNVPLGCLVATTKPVKYVGNLAGVSWSSLLPLHSAERAQAASADGDNSLVNLEGEIEGEWDEHTGSLRKTKIAIDLALAKIGQLPENEGKFKHFYLDVTGVESFKAGSSVEVCEKVRREYYLNALGLDEEDLAMRYVAPRAWQESEYHFSERRRQNHETNV